MPGACGHGAPMGSGAGAAPAAAPCVLRPVRPADAEPLGALWVAAWNATLPEIDFSTRAPWFRGWLVGHLATAVAVCAEAADGTLLGFVGFDPATGHMEQIAVHPDAAGMGVATALLDAAKAACPTGITLDVNQENPRAVAFYRREGFVITAEGVNPGGSRPIYRMAWRPSPAPSVTHAMRP